MRKQPNGSWLDTPCPPWCQRIHQPDDHPDDRRHQSEGHLLALTLSDRMPPRAPQAQEEVVLLADHGPGEQEIWIRLESVESPSVRLALTADSARDLADAIAEILREVSRFRDV